MQLSSPQNSILKSIRRAAREGSPTDSGLIVAEGPRLLREALHPTSKWAVNRVLTTPEGRRHHAGLLERANTKVTEVSARAFSALSGTETTQEIIMMLEAPRWSWGDVLGNSGVALILDGVQDPGNAGTLVRSAEAFGASGVIFLDGCVRAANGKLLRATAGSIFRIPFLEGISQVELASHITREQFLLYALAAGGSIPLTQADFKQPCVLVVGSEGRGVSREVLAKSQAVGIPTIKVESLNAAVAGSIALFEAARQRRLA
ncbi:MAG TPA: RNA methyltransferase [Bryobacteraceae bacterium]